MNEATKNVPADDLSADTKLAGAPSSHNCGVEKSPVLPMILITVAIVMI
jgi:hypothetical protein